ncbi:MAG: NUDIX domain-containing protein [Butyrivibrio sp.]|uniref:NUDIX domain-containing protein n=1 Tax=Butyrivibrio sp. TaxID=28121 RepID=UPI0025BF0047|nr:NUDIX domain-containing protein [Butyrivibrio sp.]MBQ6587704.1 NUDIX domain-containing protein [Butyrivibrio sp.]
MAYLFVHFTSGEKDSESIYFAVSEDGLHFRDIGGKKPIVKTELGSKGIRDPFIVYDENEKKYFIIATDLNTSDGDWDRAANRGSRSLFVWESEDLINWTDERLIEVGVEGAGCVWAPEAVYCRERQAWFVFWASNVKEEGEEQAKQRIYGSFTKDFREFTPAFKYIERDTNVIDTDIVWEDGYYYRFSKDETNKVIILEKSKDLVNGPFEDVYSKTLSETFGVEGPEAYYLENQHKWCLIVDRYATNSGYMPLLTDKLESGVFEVLPEDEYDLGLRKKRHGGIIRISDHEMRRLIKNESLGWREVNVEHVCQDAWIDFRKCDYELPNGEVIGPVYNYSKHSFAVVVATDENGDFICVRQYRHGIDEITTEFPAGGIEFKDKSDVPYITRDNIIATEDEAFEAARRELQEETGYVSDNWKHLLTLPAHATLSNSRVHIYAATNCKKVTEQELDDTEFLYVKRLPEEELVKRIHGGDFKQSIHVLAYYLFKENKKALS